MNRSSLTVVLFVSIASVVLGKSGDSFLHTVDSLQNLISSGSDPGAKAKWNLEISEAYLDNSIDRSIKYAFSSYQLSMEASDDSTLHQALDIIRYIHYLQGDYENLLRYSLEAIRVAKRIPYFEWIADDHGWLLMAHLELGNISKALEEGKKAIDISQSTGDTLYMCRAHTDFMNALRDNGEFDKALKHGLTALTMYNALGDRENEAFTYTEIADLYLTIKDYPGALEYGSRGKNLLDSIKSHNVVRLWNAKAIAKAHLGLGDHTVAGEYAHNAQKIAERLNATRELMELLDLRAAIAEKNGNLALALHTFKEFKTMSDSLAASSNAQKMMSIQAAFDLEATTAETTRLSELNAMNEAHLRRQRKLNDFLWIGSTALICTILVLLFFGQQTKKLRSRVEARNQRLQKQQELLEEKELELEQQQVRLTSTLMSDAHKAKQIERATESFEHAVQHQYQAVRSLVDIIIRSDESGKQMLQDRISNIEATVLNTFSGSPTFRRDLQELITLLATSMASDLTRRTTPLVRVSSEINEIGDEERFLIGLLVHELVSISYASLQFDQHIQFIKIEIAYISPTEINLSYHTNQDPITNNFHSEEIANAVSIIEYLVDKLNARATWTDLEFRTFQLVMNAEPNMAYRSIA